RAEREKAGDIFSVAFAPDGRTLVVSGQSQTEAWITFWDVATARELERVPAAVGGAVISVAYSPDGTLLATAHYFGSVKLWDAATRKELVTFPSTGRIIAVAFTPDGKTLAATSEDWTVKLWAVATREERFTLRGHQHVVSPLAFAPDGRFLVT